MMNRRFLGLSVLTAGTLLASGGGTSPPGTAEVRTLSEKVPAGGTVQVKNLFTQPVPITSGGARVATHGFNVNGISLVSPQGDSAGVGFVRDGMLIISVISPSFDFGTNLDYPFLMVTMDIPASTPFGAAFPLALGAATFQTTGGPLTLTDSKPGTLTIGGSISVRGVYPGGGTRPAGTVISVRGTGFQAGTKLSAKMKISPAIYVSPTELRFTLQEATTMDTQPIQVSNPDGSQVTFYSYLRGAPIQTPSRSLLKSAEPVFQTLTHGVAAVGPLQAMTSSQFAALAVQNPTQGQVAVTFQLQRTGATTTVILPPGGRVMDELSMLLGGAAIGADDVVTVTATSAVQILGMYGDEKACTVTPFLPAF